MKKLFKQFSFPGGIPSHVAPETPGSIHEGGELGYALSHAYRRSLRQSRSDRGGCRRRRRSGDGPAGDELAFEQVPEPAPADGAVLPILHLNGYKIANPCVLARISHEELDQLFRGYGYTPIFVEGSEPDDDASADGGRARPGRRRDSAHTRPLREQNGSLRTSAAGR